ncbi:MAG: phosphoribosylglycinamide formyltransferase [Endomicrobium sp.]|jgi:phosphoribosylglycinamide formyltransferase-1|nr:phosphoribosylglycinamide formyltransferase [Endomicrobium sp.]
MCLAVLVSGSGSNMQSIVDSTKVGILRGVAKVVLVISNNPDAYALERAKNENIKVICFKREKYDDEESFNDVILTELQIAKVDIICLAGYTRMLGQKIIKTYPRRILNIHPSLLPKFGGKGMYGHYVHEAVVEAKETKSGATVHFVEEEYDTGKSIIQREIKICNADTSQDVAQKVLSIEHQIYPEAIKKVIEEHS